MADGLNNWATNMHDACISDDVNKFAAAAKGCDINQGLQWFGRRLGISGLHCIERTPLMLATMYGSEKVLKLILDTHGVDVNRSSATDNLTALDCFFVYAPPRNTRRVLYMLQEHNAQYKQPTDPGGLNSSSNINVITGKHEPDASGWKYETENFMIYKYKAKPCSWGDLCLGWQLCPYLHPLDPIRRRELTEKTYDSSPCQLYLAHCLDGSDCRFAHGDYERQFHPDCFRTEACQNKMFCRRTACCYAHNVLEQRLRQGFDSTYPPVPPPPGPGPGPGPAVGFDAHFLQNGTNPNPAVPPSEPLPDNGDYSLHMTETYLLLSVSTSAANPAGVS